MMKISALLLLAGLFAMASALPYTATERNSLLYLPKANFVLLGSGLQQIHNQTDDPVSIKYSEGTASVDMIVDCLKKLKSLVKVAPDYQLSGNVITYHLPSAFTFDFDVNYVLTYLLAPLSGVATFRMTAQEVTYQLEVGEKTVSPKLSGKWKLEIFNISNGLALLLGVREKMTSAQAVLEAHFNAAISQVLNNDVRRFYEDYFGSMNYYIQFPHLRNASITVSRKFLKFATETYHGDSVLRATYDQSFDPIPKSEEPIHTPAPVQASEGYMRSVQMSLETLAKILQWQVHLTHNAVLTNDMIPEGTHFRADLRSLARIFPDLLQQYGNKNVTLKFNGIAENLVYEFNAGPKTITIGGLRFNLTVYLGENVPLMNTVFYLTGAFKPVFAADPEDSTKLYMNLQVVGVNLCDMSAKSLVDNPDVLFNTLGVTDYLTNMLEKYFMKFQSGKVLGSGILLSFGLPIDYGKIVYGAETGNELKITLF